MAARRGRIPNGIYTADVHVLRFYPEGAVLDVLVKPAPGPAQGALIASWLRSGNPLRGVHETRYRLAGRRISFSTEDHVHGGVVEVTGTCHDSELILDLQSRGRTLRDVHFQRIWPEKQS
ncbi:MAG: hypothetical protein ACRDOO_28755 [Actinomadura sp.]